LTEDELDAFLGLCGLALKDLQTVVDKALKWSNLREMGIKQTRPRQVLFRRALVRLCW